MRIIGLFGAGLAIEATVVAAKRHNDNVKTGAALQILLLLFLIFFDAAFKIYFIANKVLF
jgi:hypothetical protein